MKNGILLIAAAALPGCAGYGERGTGEGGREISNNGYTVRCDASPPS